MCLAIPGRILEFCDERRQFANVEISGVRRKINVDLLDGEPLGAGRLGADPRRLRDEQDQRERGGRSDAHAAMLGEDEAAMEEVAGYELIAQRRAAR